jgi:hypothetical protein
LTGASYGIAGSYSGPFCMHTHPQHSSTTIPCPQRQEKQARKYKSQKEIMMTVKSQCGGISYSDFPWLVTLCLAMKFFLKSQKHLVKIFWFFPQEALPYFELLDKYMVWLFPRKPIPM